MFIGNALIGLREGLEAALVIMVFAAFLASRGQRSHMRSIWSGVIVAVLVSVAAGILLAITASNLDARQRALFGGVASACAVVLVTTMIFWMRHSIQEERRHLENRLHKALGVGPLAVFCVAFIAVLREGLEAAVFVLVLTDGGRTGAVRSVSGLLGGIAAAVLLTWLLHTGLIRFRLDKLLSITGLLLIVLAAGILANGVADLQRAHVLPGSAAIAFDLSSTLPMDGWVGHFVSGMFGLSARPTVLTVIVWTAYAATVFTLFLMALAKPAAASRT